MHAHIYTMHRKRLTWNFHVFLKLLIVYNNLRTYINLKNMIDMHVIDHHVWGHAYMHDNISAMYFKWQLSIENDKNKYDYKPKK